MARARGYIPDPPGHRANGFHMLAAARVATTPASASVEKFLPRVMDQGATSGCVGHGSAAAIYAAMGAAGKKLPFVPSPRGIYCLGRAVDRGDMGQPLTDDGSMPNQAMRALSEWGIHPIQAPTSDGRYSDCEPSNVNDEPTLSELEGDAMESLVGWYRITSTGAARVTAIRQALAAGYPVGIGTFVASSFENWQSGDPPVGHQDENDPNGGGHFILIYAYETTSSGTIFSIRNSWSTSWADAGNIPVTEAFVQQATDLYVFAISSRELR